MEFKKYKILFSPSFAEKYVIVYNVDEKEKQVKIVDIYYQKEDYLNKI